MANGEATSFFRKKETRVEQAARTRLPARAKKKPVSAAATRQPFVQTNYLVLVLLRPPLPLQLRLFLQPFDLDVLLL